MSFNDSVGASELAWWQKTVVYQIYPRSFQDGNGDGVGDIAGIISRLSILHQLGIEALWLSPVYPSPNADFGYDIANYCAIDPIFGSLEQMEDLIQEAKILGMKIIMDGVFNHTSEEHPWFEDSVYRRNNRDDWYIWRDQPNNWTSAFGGSAWKYHPIRQQYYLHSFAPQQPDLNWRNKDVVTTILSIMEFWYQRGIAGFRLDVFNAYLKDAEFRNNLPKSDLKSRIGGLFYPYIGQRHEFDRDRLDILDVLSQMRLLADQYDAVLIGETLDEEFEYQLARRYVGENRLHLVFHFGVLHSKWFDIPKAVKQFMQDFSGVQPTWVWSNHDFVRASQRWQFHKYPSRARMMALLCCTLPGVPFIYYGEEIGLHEGVIPKKHIQDPVGKRYYPFFKGRDGARTPMKWEKGLYAGFSQAQPWLPIMASSLDANVKEAQADSESLWKFYQKWIAIRQKWALWTSDNFQWLESTSKIVAFERVLPNGQKLQIHCDFAANTYQIQWLGFESDGSEDR